MPGERNDWLAQMRADPERDWEQHLSAYSFQTVQETILAWLALTRACGLRKAKQAVYEPVRSLGARDTKEMVGDGSAESQNLISKKHRFIHGTKH